MTTPAVQVDHVWKKFHKGQMYDSLREWIPAPARKLVRGGDKSDLSGQEFWALHDVTFEVGRGESLGIIGPNGAGKSTMLKVLSQILRPNRGTCAVHGRLSALIEVGAGFHQDLTGRENIYLNGTILGMKRAEIKKKEEEIIDFAGVNDFIETPVKHYSSGMKARLGFAVAAHLEPDVLLIDEVLSVGDAKFRSKCIRHMKSLIESDVTVIFISHLLEQVRALCPTTVVLDKGKVIYHGETGRAVRVYLDALGETDQAPHGTGHDAEIRDFRLVDAAGNEALTLTAGEPARLEFSLVIRRPLLNPAVLMSINSVGGVFLGCINSRRDGYVLPTVPGTHRIRVVVDPMMLEDGDYSLDFSLHEYGMGPLYSSRQPRYVSVRGGGTTGAMVRCPGHWQATSVVSVPQEAARA